MPIQRRTLIKGALGGAAMAGPFRGLVASPAEALIAAKNRPTTLVPIKDKRDGVVRLHLPKGFNYRSFHDTATGPIILDDETVLPGRHDGMGAFAGPDDSVILIRNHEVNGPGPAFSTAAPVYDPMARGGTTTIQVTPQGKVIADGASLAGTQMNCAEEMPWGAWVTCEETVNGPDVGADFTTVSNVPLQKPHGYVFEVPLTGTASAQPITKAGRFAHEAVSFDPVEGRLYLTEDNFAFPSGFYRYTPTVNPMVSGFLGNEGALEMLKVVGVPNEHLEQNQAQGATYDVEWVPIGDPDPTFPYTPGQPAPTSNNDAINYVGNQGRALGAAHFSRAEGQVYDDGIVYFTATQGGGAAETGPELSAATATAPDRCGPTTPAPCAHLRVPVTRRRRAGLPGQHHYQQRRHAGYLRGQRGRQLHPRAHPVGRPVQHRPQPAPRPLRRRVRRIDLQPQREHAVRQHPGHERHVVRNLGTVAVDRRLTLRH